MTALTLVAVAASAQEIAIAPQIRTGDEFRLEITRTRENSVRPQQNARSTTVVDVRVLAAAAAGITLDWMPGDTTFDNAVVVQDPLLGAASAALKGLRLRLRLSGNGEFVELANQDEVRPKLQAAIDIILNDLIAKTPEAERQGMRSFIAQILSPAALIASVTNDAQTYFALNGITISVGHAVEVAIDQPNPMGGTIAARFRVQAESATPRTAALTTTTTYDSAALADMTRALVAKSGRPVSKEELDRLPAMEMSDEGRFAFDRTVGLMREVVVKRHMSMGAMQQRLDGWEIRLLKAPAR